jgi:PTH1 family peptidyl-tRNA hydrolase
VGLGNPGSEYDDTPHNVGFAVVEELARRSSLSFRRGPVAESMAVLLPPNIDAVLFRPLSYMNLSGRPVSAAVRWYKLAPKDLIVVCDDVNLPFGRLRIRASGGPGGQKGLNSIIQSLGTDEIPRLRMGVGGGYPGADVGNYVLRRLRGKELESYREMVDLGADAIEHWFANGLDAAMNRYNVSAE